HPPGRVTSVADRATRTLGTRPETGRSGPCRHPRRKFLGCFVASSSRPRCDALPRGCTKARAQYPRRPIVQEAQQPDGVRMRWRFDSRTSAWIERFRTNVTVSDGPLTAPQRYGLRHDLRREAPVTIPMGMNTPITQQRVIANGEDHPGGFPQLPQQQEMPLALVRGQPLLEMPQDLYIPPDALEVILEAFEGPLDLLLYLIRRQNLDILDIPIAEITRQYVEYIDLMRELRLELAAEYLVMAAMLAEIKSRMLLPRSAEVEGEEDDPRAELVRRLQEYERYKQAAE